MKATLSLLVVAALVAGTRQSPLSTSPPQLGENGVKTDCKKAKTFKDDMPCGYVSADNRIKEGTINNITEFPWTALLFYGDGDLPNPECNGVLINKYFVVTVAHCLKKNIKFVRLGEYDLREDPEGIDDKQNNKTDFYCTQIDIDPKRIIIHPQYDPTDTKNEYHDIALIELQNPVNYTYFIQPICLPDKSLEISANRHFTASGWGLTKRFQKQGYSNIPSPVKLKEDLPLFDRERCQDVYSNYQISLGRGQLCVGGQLDKDTCRGDSGSALMMVLDNNESSNWMLVGLVSRGPQECGTEGKPGIYTNVKEYVDWIKENVGDVPSRTEG